MKLKVAVISGGVSPEREISFRSGAEIARNLDRSQFMVYPVFFHDYSEWYFKKKPAGPDDAFSPDDCRIMGDKSWKKGNITNLVNYDFAFLALHGGDGEDGSIQSTLDFLGVHYNGSGFLGSRLAMDKVAAKELYRKNGIQTPQYGNFYRNFWGELAEKAVAVSVERFGFPFIVKVPDQGSSCGVFKVKDKSSALFAFKEIYKTSSTLIVEDCVEGLEVSCGVLESNGIAKALTPTAIIPEKSDFFDMASKYESGGASEITPAPLPDEVTEMVRKTALEAHKCLGCLIYSRTDMIIKDEVIFVLETNTLPGFTKTSLLPQNAAASGIEYKTLLSQIVNESIEGFSGHKV